MDIRKYIDILTERSIECSNELRQWNDEDHRLLTEVIDYLILRANLITLSDKYYPIDKIANLLGVDESTIMTWYHEGRFSKPYIEVVGKDSKILFSLESVMRFINMHKDKSQIKLEGVNIGKKL